MTFAGSVFRFLAESPSEDSAVVISSPHSWTAVPAPWCEPWKRLNVCATGTSNSSFHPFSRRRRTFDPLLQTSLVIVLGEKLTLCTTFPCRQSPVLILVIILDTSCTSFLTKRYCWYQRLKECSDIFIKKILPYNLHGTMAYYTPLYTSYICSETFKTV